MINSLKEEMKTKNIKRRREEIIRFLNDKKYQTFKLGEDTQDQYNMMEDSHKKHSDILDNYKIENESLGQAISRIERDIKKRIIERDELVDINQEIKNTNFLSNTSSLLDPGVDNSSLTKLKLSKYPNYYKYMERKVNESKLRIAEGNDESQLSHLDNSFFQNTNQDYPKEELTLNKHEMLTYEKLNTVINAIPEEDYDNEV